jgi:hypothetical protein
MEMTGSMTVLGRKSAALFDRNARRKTGPGVVVAGEFRLPPLSFFP